MTDNTYRYSHHDGEFADLEALNAELLEALEAIIAINIPYPTTNVQGMKASEMKSIARAAIAKAKERG